ncbi:MAG: bifunctional methylenetetrahydrofolate dehydrogenase/methenyltetrahydrofolate cyclohydrolase FolD [Hydrotalea sp.]|nr:bifunctional methylenetetrahydrofolate dehydrogenase/methenyltetrahydrofolate cyclohydrolase FolD [Hydrotalea sp.]
MTTIIDGKVFAENLVNDIAREAKKIIAKGVKPCLVVVLVGDNPASEVYVKNKIKTTIAAGMESREHRLPAATSEKDLLDLIDKLNRDPSVNGILVQLPLPKGLDEHKVIQTISAEKDVDGFHLTNVGLLSTGGKNALVPCTPYGCLLLLQDYFKNKDLAGRKAAVIGRSNIVGKPMFQLLLSANATPTILHSKTKNMEKELAQYDIVVAAVGVPEMVKGAWLKKDAVVIDVGINRIERNGKKIIVGDVDTASAMGIAAAITPVPGGVGPMTIACLLRNTLVATARQHGLPEPQL